MVVTGGWDGLLKYTDMNNGTALDVAIGERIYAIDTAPGMVVVSTAQKRVYSFDVNANPSNYSTVSSHYKMNTHLLGPRLAYFDFPRQSYSYFPQQGRLPGGLHQWARQCNQLPSSHTNLTKPQQYRIWLQQRC